jgi:acyl-CoA hydrolase
MSEPFDLTPKSPSQSAVQMTELVMPQHANVLGTCFGGVILSWIDIAAAICARRHTGVTCVTAAFDDVHFHTAIRLGDVVNISARATYAGRTSMEIQVDLVRERFGQEHERAITAFVTFVAVEQIDGVCVPRPLPPLLLGDDEERRRFAEGAQRRKERLARARVGKD